MGLNRRIQHITLSFTALNQELSGEVILDDRFNLLEKITIQSASIYPAPASISAIEIDDDSSLIQKGTLASQFQNLIGQEDLKIDLELIKSQIKVKITAKDESAVFSAYSLQFALHLRKK